MQLKVYSVSFKCEEPMLLDVLRALTQLDVESLDVKHWGNRPIPDDEKEARP